jgi:hypothetical protein
VLRLGAASQKITETNGIIWPAFFGVMVQRTLEAARGSLSPEAAGAAWMEGWTIPLEQAMAEVLEEQTA